MSTDWRSTTTMISAEFASPLPVRDNSYQLGNWPPHFSRHFSYLVREQWVVRHSEGQTRGKDIWHRHKTEMSGTGRSRLQSTRRLVPSEKRKRALFSCDRCKLRKTKCNRIQNNDLKYDNITPCLQCSKAGVSCTTSIPRKKRFYGPVKNIALHYKCLLAMVTGLFPDSDVYNIEELIDIGHKLKLEMPTMDSVDEVLDKSEKESLEKLKRETKHMDVIQSQAVKHEHGSETSEEGWEYETTQSADASNASNVSDEATPAKAVTDEKTSLAEEKRDATDTLLTSKVLHKNAQEADDNSQITHSPQIQDINNDPKILEKKLTQNVLSKLPPGLKIKSNSIDNDRLIMDKFGHTHFIGNFGTASLLNGLCDIIIKRSYNQQNPPTSTQDIRDSSVQTITSENVPVYQYPSHLYNLDTINVDRFPLINIVERSEADAYVKIFFEKVHPYYFIFIESHFMEKYGIFWEELDLNVTKDTDRSHTLSRLSSAEICTIYTVWILGRRFQQYADPEKLPKNSVLDQDMIGKFIDIIKLSLSDVVLTPSIDGIRLLILFSVYLSSIKVRESGYCLMELAAIQAKSLGLHRKSIVNKFNDQKSDVMKRILWSLAKAETTLCCSFGRASAIPWEEIDIHFPVIEDETDEHFKIYYLQSCNLTKIIFKILDYKKKTQRDPLSLVSIEKALYFKKKLESFWGNLPESWKNYKSLPIKRYKPKLHIQYHYYYITLTLPMFLHIVNSHNYIVKNDDPFLSLLVCGIRSSFKTAEIVSYTDSKGFFNGTIYYDVFYCYNAVMVLTLTYILFKSSQPSKTKQIIDLNNLNSKYNINLEAILQSINLIRKLVLNNLHQIDGTMKRMSDIIETLLEDLGIIQTLVKKYNAPASNVKKIEGKDESGNTSVTSIPTGYRRLKINLNKYDSNKRKRSGKVASTLSTEMSVTSSSKCNALDNADLVSYGTEKENARKVNADFIKSKRARSHPVELVSNDLKDASSSGEKSLKISHNYRDEADVLKSYSPNTYMPENEADAPLTPFIYSMDGNSSTNLFSQGFGMPQNGSENDNTNTEENPMMSSDINDVLSSMSLNTDLMDALFGTDLLNLDSDSMI